MSERKGEWVCSICGKPVETGCPHKPGQTYTVKQPDGRERHEIAQTLYRRPAPEQVDEVSIDRGPRRVGHPQTDPRVQFTDDPRLRGPR